MVNEKNIDRSTSFKVGIIALLGCLLWGMLALKLQSPPKALPTSADPTLFSAERAMKHLKVIAKEPHSVGTRANDQVINYLASELKTLGLTVSIQDTLVSKYSKRRQATTLSRVKNIIGRIAGSDNSKAVLLMAHHDSQPNTGGAADDGSGVVAILETIRAIKAQGALKNDLIVLFTDAEEIGLMGAKAFVQYHPFVKDIGVLINLEARGNEGVSMSFELNTDNGWLVEEYAKSAPYPFANSLGYEIYKIMPNDTDFSEFKKEDIAGINSACVEGFVNYHSMTDTPENISLDLVQHHGSNMLGMLAHFGNLDIKTTKARDAIFFNPIGSLFINYSSKYNIFFIFLTFALFVATVGIGIRKKRVVLQQLMTGTGYFLVTLALTGIGSYLLQQVIIALNPHYTLFYANNFYNVGYYFISFLGLAGLFYSMIFSYQSRLDGLSLSLGGILMLIMAVFGLTLSLPTGAYLLYYPLAIYLMVQLALMVFDIHKDQPIPYAVGQFMAVVPAIALWVPTVYLLFSTFGLSLAVVAPPLLFCFLLLLLMPITKLVLAKNSQLLKGLSVGVILFGILGGHFTSTPTKEQPLQTFLMYGYDADNKKAVWATNKKYKNEWVKQIIPEENTSPFTEIYPDWKWQIWKQPAAELALSPSNLQVIQDSLIENGKRLKEINVQTPNPVNSMEFFIEKGKEISDLKINGYKIEVTPRTQGGYIYFNFFAPPKEGFQLSFNTTLDNHEVKIVNRTIGLPKQLLSDPMPEHMIHGTGRNSNVTLIKKTYNL